MSTSHQWIYLSPHLDDAVLSCGGLIWEQAQCGCQVEVWTIFAGDPPPTPLTTFAQSLHDRWGSGLGAVQERRAEDGQACSVLGAGFYHFPYPDCIYRRTQSGQPVIELEDDLFSSSPAREDELEDELFELLKQRLPRAACVAAPFGIGKHIDHQLLRRVLERIGAQLWFYADYPYSKDASLEKDRWQNQPGKTCLLPVSAQGLWQWQCAVAAYQSQISTFWSSLERMRSALEAYWRSGGGSLLRALPAVPGSTRAR